MGIMRFLGCAVPGHLWDTWEHHLSPAAQPFFVSQPLTEDLGVWPRWKRSEFSVLGLPLSLTDTFSRYAVSPELPWALLLDEPGFNALPEHHRTLLLREQSRAGGRRRSLG